MRGAALILLAVHGAACLSSPEQAGRDAAADAHADAGACEVVFADEFERTEIGDDWQYYGGGTELVARGVAEGQLFLQATGGADPDSLDDYAFGLVHTVERHALATRAIEVALVAEPGESGDIFFGWLDDNLYLGMQALSNGSMSVVEGTLGASQKVHCSGCVDVDPAARSWRIRPVAEGLAFEVSTDRRVWTRLTTVDPDLVAFQDATPAVWAECNQTFSAAVQVDSAVVSVCGP